MCTSYSIALLKSLPIPSDSSTAHTHTTEHSHTPARGRTGADHKAVFLRTFSRLTFIGAVLAAALLLGFTAPAPADSGASQTFTWILAPEYEKIGHYQYRLSTDDGDTWDPDWTVIAGSDANTTSFLLTGLTHGITYKFQLRAVNIYNTAGASAEVTFTPLFAAPSNLVAFPNSGRVDLKWDTNSEVTQYRVDIEVTSTGASHASSPISISAAAGPETTATIRGLTNDTEYTFTVVAVQGSLVTSEPSSENATPMEATAAGVTIWPTSLTVPENGSADYTVALDIQPTDNVTITVRRGGSGGDLDLTASLEVLTFTNENWDDDPQTVTVSAKEDDDGEAGKTEFLHSVTSDDLLYNSIDIAGVSVTESDDDPVGVTVSPQALRVPEGGSASYTVKLDTEPLDDVTITVTPEQRSDADLTRSPETLIFTRANWDEPQTVTVSAAEDADRLNGNAAFYHSASSNDTDYTDDKLTPTLVTATEVDNDKDRTRPRVTIRSAAAAPVGGAFAVTIRFSESVRGFSLTDIGVRNGTASDFKRGTSRTYTATITPAASGQVEVAVGADVAEDRAGNGNRRATPLVLAADLERPTVTIAGPAELVGLTEFAVTITFSEPVVGFERADLQISNGRVTAFAAVSPRVYRATLTITPEASGEVRVAVGADVAQDRAGNGNWPAVPFVLAAALQSRFESPADGATVSGIALIQGWTFAGVAGVGIADIVVYIDGQHETTIPCCSLRGDVHAAYPDFPAANTTASGWGLTYNWGNLAAGAHTLQVVATSSQGVRWESAVHTIQVLKPGDVVFADRLSLAMAAVWLEDEELVLDGVVIRDKASQQEQAIAAHYGWQTAVQGLRLVATAPVEPAPLETGRAGVARLLAELAAWGRWLLSPARVTATPGLTAAYEAPADQAVVAGIGLIQGWAFAAAGSEIATVTLHMDGATSGPAPCCSERGDVATAYPDELGALDSGWGLVFNYGNLAAGAHTIGVRITTEAGGAETTEHTVTVVQLGGYAFVDAFDVSGAAVWIEGEEIVLSGVEVRDKATQATQLVEVRLRWSSATQGLTIVGSAPVP